MKKLLFGLGLLVPFLLSAQQVPRSVTASNGTFIGFYEYKPPAYSSNPNGKFPLIIFLHGIGERGDGSSTLSSVLNVGIPRNIHYGLTDMSFNYNGTQQSFLVLSPQLSYNYGNWQPFYIDEMIKYAKQNLRVDTNRIYLTGLSLGGGGVWNYASSSAARAKSLAAIAPICATCDWSSLCNIAQQALPVWAFHANDDGVVGVGCTQAAVAGITACGASVLPQTTYYPTGNHWIWDQVYDPANPQLYTWFLSKSRGGSSTPPPPTGNVAPVANAGSAQTITLPANSASLTGSGSYDQDGTITTNAWSQVSGPSTASIVNANVANTSVGGLVAGTYTFRLTVTDNAGATNAATVTITVNNAVVTNAPPVAVVSGNQTITLPANSAFLLGSGSYDAGGWITGYAWTQESGPGTATIAAVSTTNLDVKNMVAGTYVFKLTVTDNQGATGTANVQVTVNGTSSAAPVANAGSNQTLTLPTNSATLNGSASSGVTSYNWTSNGGPSTATISNGTTAFPTVSNLVAGTYTFRLTVANAAGATSTADVQVVVNSSTVPGNQNPVAAAGSNQAITLPTNSVFLYGSGSYDPGGGYITNYAWTQQSGPSTATINTISSTNVEVKNMIAGTYVFKLTVTDNQGATGSSTVQVTVNGTTPPPSGNTPPVALAGGNQAIALPINSVMLSGSGSYDMAGGWVEEYEWIQQSGPSQSTITYVSNSNIEAKNLIAGTYVYKLTVEDNQGATASATVSVTVTGSTTVPGNTAPVAAAGSNQYITLPTNAVYLMGGGSYDVGGWVSSFAWSQVSGPNTATLTTISTSNVEAKNLTAGTYTFRLTVTDNQGATGTATMQVFVYGSGARTASTTTDVTSAPLTTSLATSSTSSTPLVSNTANTPKTTTASSTNSLVLYPNPVTTTMTVELNNSLTGDFQINVVNASGIAVKSIKATKTSAQFIQQVNMRDVAQGTYVVEIRFADGTRLSGQVVKQ
ncbi:MAG: PKD domain-containing protein [Chitinophagaceae bacterium]